MHRPVFSLALPLLLTSVVALAQTPELITDRPDQTESAAVVPLGSVQLEVGWGFEHHSQSGLSSDAMAVPGTLVRIGLAERLELRLGWEGYLDESVEGAGSRLDASGPGDAEVGAKLILAEATDRHPQFALLVATSVPLGDKAFTTDHYDPSFRLAMDHTLGEQIGLGVNLGAAWESGPDAGGDVDTVASWVYTAALGFDLSDSVGAFVELFGSEPANAGGANATSIDGGVTWLLRDNLQLDLAGGVGVTEEAPDWFIGIGLSVRWPE